MAAPIQQSNVYSGTPGPSLLQLLGVAGGSDIVVLIGRESSAAREYIITTNLDAGDFVLVGDSRPSLGTFPQYIFVKFGVSAGNHDISIAQVAGTAQNMFCTAFECTGLDPLATPIASTFYDGVNDGDHYAGAVGDVDTAGPTLMFAIGRISGSNSGTAAGTGWTKGTVGGNQQYFGWRDSTSAETDQRGHFTNAGTARFAYACMVAFPLVSGTSDVEGSGSVPVQRPNAAGTATVAKPVYTGVGSVTLRRIAAVALATVTAPAFTGVGTVALQRPNVTASATVEAPVYTGVGAVTLQRVNAVGAATVDVPVFTGAGAVTLQRPSAAGTGDITAPAGAASGVVVLQRPAASGSATVEVPTYTGVGAVDLQRPGAAGTGAVATPVYTGAGTVELRRPAAVGTGDITPPVGSAFGVVVLQRPAAVGSGVAVPPPALGLGLVALQRPTVSGAALIAPPVYSGAGTVTLGRPTVAGLGAVTPPVASGLGLVALGRPAALGAATVTKPTATALGVVVLPRVEARGAATVVNLPIGRGTVDLQRPRATGAATVITLGTLYQRLDVLGPFDFGVDEQGRVMYRLAVVAHKSFSEDTIVADIIQRLQDGNVGTPAVNIFHSSKMSNVKGDGPLLVVTETGGAEPEEIHNVLDHPAYERPGIAITARAASTEAARGMAWKAYDALVGVNNQLLGGATWTPVPRTVDPSGTWYRRIAVRQQPFDSGLDQQGRVMYKFNILADKRPSQTFVEEVLQVLVTANVGQASVNIFHSSNVAQLKGAGPFLSVIETSGMPSDRTHGNTRLPAYERPGAQIVVRASATPVAKAMAWAAWRALAKVRNRYVQPLT
jgi:hypothetical protein